MQYVFVIACRRSRLSVHARRLHIQQAKCEHLALSSNNIEKVTGLKGLKSLKVLSLGRNLLKKFDGIEEVAESLEQLWLSYNLIEKMAGVEALTNLKTLALANNNLKGLPAEIFGLESLITLDISGNQVLIVLMHAQCIEALMGLPAETYVCIRSDSRSVRHDQVSHECPVPLPLGECDYRFTD